MGFFTRISEAFKRGLNEAWQEARPSGQPVQLARRRPPQHRTERSEPAPQQRVETADLRGLSAEDFEILRTHEFFVDFEEGMWLYYKDNIGDGKNENEQKTDFENLCKSNARQNLEYLLQNGELSDYRQWLQSNRVRTRAVTQPAAVVDTAHRPQEPVISRPATTAPETATTTRAPVREPARTAPAATTSARSEVARPAPPRARSAQPAADRRTEQGGRFTGNWWLGKVFVTGDGQELKVVKVDEAQGSITFQKPGAVEAEAFTRTFAEVGNDLQQGALRTKDKAPVDTKSKPIETRTEAKEWREVSRTTEVLAVGDLHSSYVGYKENLKSLGVVREDAWGELQWIGGDKKVVFIGDIIGDRQLQGLKILEALAKLEPQVQAAGGSLDFLAGNHDDFVLAYLAGRKIAGGGDPINNCQVGDQGIDLLDLSEFGSDELKNYDWGKFEQARSFEKQVGDTVEQVETYDPVWELMRQGQGLIIENMRKDTRGRLLLEQMCKFKIAEVHDDTLFIHTDFTAGMARSLLQGRAAVAGNIKATVRNINEYFQVNLRKILLEGQEPDSSFDSLRNVFLDTSNRQDFTSSLTEYEQAEQAYQRLVKTSQTNHVPPAQLEGYRRTAEAKLAAYTREKDEIQDLVRQFKALGVNAVVRGHSGGTFNENFSDSQFPIISSDMSAFKGGPSQHRSILKIRTDGVMERSIHPGLSSSGGKSMAEVRS